MALDLRYWRDHDVTLPTLTFPYTLLSPLFYRLWLIKLPLICMYIDILYNFIYFYEFHNILRFSIFYIIFWCNYVLYLLDVFVFSCPLTCNSFWIWPFCTGPGFDFAQWITIYVMILIVIFHSFVMFTYYNIWLIFFPCVTEKPSEITCDIYSGAHRWVLLPVWLKNLVKSFGYLLRRL